MLYLLLHVFKILMNDWNDFLHEQNKNQLIITGEKKQNKHLLMISVTNIQRKDDKNNY